MKKWLLFWVFGGSLIQQSLAMDEFPILQLNPTATLWGYAGKEVVGKAQTILPLLGSQEATLFGVIEAAGSTKKANGYMGGLGLGYRRVIEDSYILGGYVLGDYSNSPHQHRFLVVNPGVELLGYQWEARMNGYLPISSRHWYGEEYWADALGIYDFMHFSGNTQYNTKFRSYEESGYGLDVEIGTRMPWAGEPKVLVGGYHFINKTLGDITGVTARIVYPVNKYLAFDLRGTYDNEQKSVAMLGVRLTLGGNSEGTGTFGVAARLTEPVEHNLSTLAKGYATPIKTQYINKHVDLVEREHIQFVRPGSEVTGSGTYEDPYIGFNQATLDNMVLDPAYQTYLYLAAGDYDLQLTLPANLSVLGRTTNYQQPEKVVCYGALEVRGGHNLLDSLELRNNGTFEYGLKLQDVSNVYLNNIVVGVAAYPTGVELQNANNIYFNNTKIYGTDSALKMVASFVNILDSNQIQGISSSNSTLNLTGVTNTIVDRGITVAGGTFNLFGDYNHISATALDASAYGIYVQGNGIVNIGGTNNIVSAEVANGIASALLLQDASILNLEGTQNQLLATGLGQLVSIDVQGGSCNLSGTRNKISASGAASIDNPIVGIRVGASGTANISGTDNTITGSTMGVQVQGGTLLVAGDANRIYGVSESNSFGSVLGVLAEGGLVKVTGANNIFGGLSYENAYGIVLQNSQLDMSGANNSIQGISYGANANGLTLQNSILNLTGSKNTITAEAQNTSHGIWATASNLIIAGADNAITGTTANGVARGIYSKDGTVSVTKAMITSDNYGIDMLGSTASLDVTDTTLQVGNKDAIGIYMEQEAPITALSVQGLTIKMSTDAKYGISADVNIQQSEVTRLLAGGITFTGLTEEQQIGPIATTNIQ